jgi:hypothetical protein
MSPGLGLLIVFAAGLGAFVFLVGRPHTLVRFEGRKAVLVRGTLPPGLLNDLKAVARGLEEGTSGRLGIHGQGGTLKLKLGGLPDFAAQRVRNVVLLQKSRIRRR